ncbi:MAG: alpha-glucan family phosphorylase [Bacteroidales bacterium]|nr:alpha-glucan family phosphorylase [Bacteroidales bacterium]
MKTKEISYLFETSWEVCNKVGGIYTVISSKAQEVKKIFGENYFLIGPDIWREKNNTEFIEDKNLYTDWKRYAETQGVLFRIGRWNIKGSPIVILVDFSSLISKKDNIFAEFWEEYHLDSISGQWDYIEPTLFGYAAAKVVETFHTHEAYPQEKIYAHFHEWMTGSGVLYLKKNVPQVATCFTAHATVLGRSIAGSGFPLYGNIEQYDGDDSSYKFNVRSKYSMEKLAAVHADALTVVSEITDVECKQFLGKNADTITTNGFDGEWVPEGDDFDKKRSIARKKLQEVTSALLNTPVVDDAVYVINSGRYEFKNKGIDLFIDSLAELRNKNQQKTIVAYLTIPANHAGARTELLERMKSQPKDNSNAVCKDFCTHYLNGYEYDSILKRLDLAGFKNSPEDNVKIVFVPCYLDGMDGIFNLSYYDLLIGFDISVFPSYYEPWGYTPLESISFSIPTVTTSLAGFGCWVKESFKNPKGVLVIERNDTNESEVVSAIAEYLQGFVSAGKNEVDEYRKSAYEVSREALWSKFIKNYKETYRIAGKRWENNLELLNKEMPLSQISAIRYKQDAPDWKKIMVKPNTPGKLGKLKELSLNLWWSWDSDATELFANIDKKLWNDVGHNPIELLSRLTTKAFDALENDKKFLSQMDKVYTRFKTYMDEGKNRKKPQVAYFSMEFGLHESLKIYSGGLGILAGDYLKSASDKNVDMAGIGLLYRYGYFNQVIATTGEQISEYLPQKFSQLPLLPARDKDGNWITVGISLPGRKLIAKVWRVDVGRIPLFLLDTDIEENSDADKSITHHLYGGDWENRFKQELLLGVGGVRALRKLGYAPEVFHCNEGHAAFMVIERLKEYVEGEHLSFYQARELVRASSLFTTHTPVPAGHDAFSEDIMRKYIYHYAFRLHLEWDEFMGFGRSNPEDTQEKFSMSFLAANMSSYINGVSRIHGRVSREIFAPLYPGYFPHELENIGYVTNGVHLPTWTNSLWKDLYTKNFGEDILMYPDNFAVWEKIHAVPDVEIASIRNVLRKKLIDFVRERINMDLPHRGDSPEEIDDIAHKLNDKTLTIGFARRFATYKRAHLLFNNLERLSKIVNDPNHPVQFLFAGKAHPHDKAGQDLIKMIVEISRRKEFIGKIVFVENYDVDVARHLVQGVDIWLNNPTRPLEASGTSGEKAIMNGVLNLSVLDGWWAEGYVKGAGWALKEERTYTNQYLQDKLDASTIYHLIENEIVPAFYEGKKPGASATWIKFIKNNIAKIAPNFTMRRQLNDYCNKYYYNIAERFNRLKENNYSEAFALAGWRLKVLNRWEKIKMRSSTYLESTNNELFLGDIAHFEIMLDLAGLSNEDIGVEVVFGQKQNDEMKEILFVCPLHAQKEEGVYVADFEIPTSGVFDFAFRVYPKNELLPTRQEFPIVKWF